MRSSSAIKTYLFLSTIIGCADHASTTSAPTVLPQAAEVLLSPASMALRVGDTIFMSARARDSTERTISGAAVTWSSSNPAVARVDRFGTVAGVALGTTTITATTGGVSGVATVTVYSPLVASVVLTAAPDSLLTDHHFLLIASTYDQVGHFASQVVNWTSSDATVAIVDSSGHVRGIAPGVATITAAAGTASTSVKIKVVLAPPSPDISGDWAMTLSASPACRDKLPAIARDRQYLVRFTQQGDDFRLNISSPTLEVADPGENSGSMVGSTIAFSLLGDTEYGSFSSTDLHDHLGDGTTLDFDGSVSGLVIGTEIHATLNGDLEIGPESSAGPLAICRATDHLVTLSRPNQPNGGR